MPAGAERALPVVLPVPAITPNRDSARPYTQVPGFLDEIMKAGRTRVIVVSGRSARGWQPSSRYAPHSEIRGLNGLERMNAAGLREMLLFSDSDLHVLAEADVLLSAAGLSEYLEIKAGSVAVHWRDLAPQEASLGIASLLLSRENLSAHVYR